MVITQSGTREMAKNVLTAKQTLIPNVVAILVVNALSNQFDAIKTHVFTFKH